MAPSPRNSSTNSTYPTAQIHRRTELVSRKSGASIRANMVPAGSSIPSVGRSTITPTSCFANVVHREEEQLGSASQGDGTYSPSFYFLYIDSPSANDHSIKGPTEHCF